MALNMTGGFPAGMDDSTNPFQKYLDMLLSKSGGGLSKPPATMQAGQNQPRNTALPQPPPPQPQNPYTQALQGVAAPVVNSMGNQFGKDIYGAGKQGVGSAVDYFKSLGGPSATQTAVDAAPTATSNLDLSQFAEMFPELAAYMM